MTRTFFGANMPSDVCEISAEEHTALMAAPSQGRIISPDKDGRPVITEAQAPTQQQLVAAERSWRDETLVNVCKVRDRHRDEQELFRTTTLTPVRFVELLGYIQKLRDWPQSVAFPNAAERPLPPSWLTEQS
jgi:hypothetical protein